MNFAHFPEMHARSDPDAPALVDSRLRLTYGGLDEAACRFANLLARAGAGEGSRAAFYLPNRVEFAICFLGALKAGVIAVPINWRLGSGELATVLEHCAPQILVTTETLAANVSDGHPFPVLSVSDAPREGSFWSAISGQPGAYASCGRQSDDVANLLYTSGTTGVPKAAIHTYGMRSAIAGTMIDRFAMSRRDVGLAVSPMFHTGGLSVFANAMFCGCAVALMERWDLDDFIALVGRERVTYMHLISTVVVDIVRAPASRFADVDKTVRFTWGGGHSTDADLFREYERRVGGVYLQGYSRTEGGITYNLLSGEERRFSINGYPSRDNSEIAILEEGSDRECAPGTPGEIAVRGDGVAPGYWNRDTGVIRHDRMAWQRTGDIGHRGADGALVFVGRRDHMIKTGGENVYPNEVLGPILEMPQVSDAVVFDMPHDRLGQCVAALVVAKPGAQLRPETVDEACRAELAGFKIPRRLAVVDELPRLGSQKVDLAACRQLLTDMEAELAAE